MQDFIRLEGSLKAQELLKGHAFTTPVVQWVLGCLSECQFEGVPPLLHSFLESTWSSLLNSKLVEDGNKIQREEEQRGTTSKKVSPQQGWFCLTQHKLLAKNHRNEIKATEQLRVPKDWDINSLFQHTRARQGITEEELADEKFLREILGKVTWPTHNPQSEQEHFADFALLQKLQRLPDPWCCLETSWWASFCPEGHVVEQAGHPALVIRAYKRGCLVWPMEYFNENMVNFQQVASLSWLFLFDDSIVVRSVHPRCPQAGNGTRFANQGVTVHVQEPLPLLQWQVQHGFPGVREAQLRLLAKSLGCETAPPMNGDQELHLAIHCMVNLDPSLTAREVTHRALQRSDLQLEPVQGVEGEILDAIRDTLLPAEQQKAWKQ